MQCCMGCLAGAQNVNCIHGASNWGCHEFKPSVKSLLKARRGEVVCIGVLDMDHGLSFGFHV